MATCVCGHDQNEHTSDNSSGALPCDKCSCADFTIDHLATPLRALAIDDDAKNSE